jgi:hypothetical protein
MTETFAAAPGAAGNSNEGIAALSRLTERLNAVTPAASPLAAPAPLNARFSPVVTAALISCGPGQVSIDHLIKLATRDKRRD